MFQKPKLPAIGLTGKGAFLLQSGERMTRGRQPRPKFQLPGSGCTRRVKRDGAVGMQLYQHDLKAGSGRSAPPVVMLRLLHFSDDFQSSFFTFTKPNISNSLVVGFRK